MACTYIHTQTYTHRHRVLFFFSKKLLLLYIRSDPIRLSSALTAVWGFPGVQVLEATFRLKQYEFQCSTVYSDGSAMLQLAQNSVITAITCFCSRHSEAWETGNVSNLMSSRQIVFQGKPGMDYDTARCQEWYLSPDSSGDCNLNTHL